jgi:hypothetical protein
VLLGSTSLKETTGRRAAEAETMRYVPKLGNDWGCRLAGIDYEGGVRHHPCQGRPSDAWSDPVHEMEKSCRDQRHKEEETAFPLLVC